MAATISKIIDSQRKLVIKLTGDGAEGRTIKVDAGGLNFALNTNNQILGTGTDRKAQYRLHLKSVRYDVAGGGYVVITGDGDAANALITMSTGNEFDFNEGGEPYTLNVCQVANATGNVYLQTVGTVNGYTVIMDFRKNGQDFDQGQTADPMAFNSGIRSPMGGGRKGFG